MITSYDFETDENNRELIRSYTADFPCSCKFTDFDLAIGHVIPWHWHPAFEINYILEGGGIVVAENQSVPVKKGDALFVNANVIHSVHTPEKGGICRHYSLFFDMHFLGGAYGSIFETKYIYPIARSRSLPLYKISPDSPSHLKMVEAIADITDLFVKEPFGYEFQIRNRLSDFWCMLLEDTAPVRKAEGDVGAQSRTLSDRMRPMLEYIDAHYGENIQLSDIARAGSVSERECSRVFSRAIGTSPVSYLNNYRIRTAARELAMTQDSITVIGSRCGFSSASHFAQVFRSVMECTPREYRKSHAQPERSSTPA